jgi:hypothetical protein
LASAEKRGGLWRARWLRPDGSKDGESGFESKKAALEYARDQESDIRKGSWVDPRLAKTMLGAWVNIWYPAQDLEPSTLENRPGRRTSSLAATPVAPRGMPGHCWPSS